MRKLATIRQVKEVRPIEDADAIEHVRVDGWWVVCKKNYVKVGDIVLYLEIDSWVPYYLAPFLSKGKEPNIYQGVPGERLRTIKLRGAISQGLILKTDIIPEFSQLSLRVGDDYTEMLGILKWEHPIKCTQKVVKGSFPSYIPKTDQERIQNKLEVFDDLESNYEITLKLDGSSMTVFCNEDGNVGVCSRNLELDLNHKDDPFVYTANLYNLFSKVKTYFEATGQAIALQGELMGPKIQNNKECLKEYKFYCFDIYNITEQRYLLPFVRQMLCKELDIEHIPIFFKNVSLNELGWTNINIALDGVTKFYYTNFSTPIEGVVFKHTKYDYSFKIINNNFLLKEQ